MSPELTEALLKDFPLLFDKTHPAYGFQCDDGWYKLIRDLAEKLTPLVAALPIEEQEECKVAQFKEKFAGIRWYQDNTTPEMYNLINETETLSLKTCELCGREGKVRSISQYWLKTICDTCELLK